MWHIWRDLYEKEVRSPSQSANNDNDNDNDNYNDNDNDNDNKHILFERNVLIEISIYNSWEIKLWTGQETIIRTN